MSFSSGTFTINSTGNPVVTGTTISSTWANALTSDLATGLSTCVLKDGTQTLTANIPIGGFKLTGLAAGTATGHSLRWDEIYSLANGAINEAQGANIASAATINLTTATGNYVNVTGTVTITAITLAQGAERTVQFSGALILTNGASLILPGAANVTTTVGDTAIFRGEAAGVVRCIQYTKASAAPVTLSPITNSLASDVLLNNGGIYFTGPTIAQGTVGTWFVSGTVTHQDGVAYTLNVKLWDGTTVIASSSVQTTAGISQTVSLSGFITSPAGNLRISALNATTTGAFKFNVSGNSKDCTITAIRIA